MLLLVLCEHRWAEWAAVGVTASALTQVDGLIVGLIFIHKIQTIGRHFRFAEHAQVPVPCFLRVFLKLVHLVNLFSELVPNVRRQLGVLLSQLNNVVIFHLVQC